MARCFAGLLVLVALPSFGGCGGDDTVNPTNPDASAAKAGDAGVRGDGPKDGASGGAKAVGDASHDEAAVHDASDDA
jgi:hypothetical protein